MSILAKYNQLLNKNVSMVQFLSIFSDENECLELYFLIQYHNQKCKKCDRVVTENYVRVKAVDKNNVQKKSFRCKSCHTHIYPMATSIFRKTSVRFNSIFLMLYFFASKKNTSAIDMTKYTNISYKTSHKLMMAVRDVMYDDLGRKLFGTVEVDEVFIGKGSKVYNWSGISTRKQPIVGMIERETKKAKIFLVGNRNASTLSMLIKNNIEFGSNVYTDGWAGYLGLKNHYNHGAVNHSEREFANGDIHTGTIDNLWGYFKRNIRGAHIHITAKYVQLYMNELCWRHNHKDEMIMQRFDRLLRSTYQFICNVSTHNLLNTNTQYKYTKLKAEIM